MCTRMDQSKDQSIPINKTATSILVGPFPSVNFRVAFLSGVHLLLDYVQSPVGDAAYHRDKLILRFTFVN